MVRRPQPLGFERPSKLFLAVFSTFLSFMA